MWAHRMITEWANSDLTLPSFLSLFNVRGTASELIYESIGLLSSLGNEYRRYLQEIGTSTFADKNAHEKSSLLFANIFADLCIMIKLASEGYIDQSLRILRGALDVFTLSTFSIASWDETSKKTKDGVNPFVISYDHGTWPYLREMNPREYYYRGTWIGNEENKKLSSAEDIISKEANKIYRSLTGKNPKTKKLNPEEKRSLESIEMGVADALITYLPSSRGSWNHIEGASWSQHKTEIRKLFYFWKVYTHSKSLVWYSCKKHSSELLQDLEKNFKQFDPRMTEDSLTGAIFSISEESSEHPFCPYCLGRRSRSSLFSIRVRPSNRLMLELSREWLPSMLVNDMDTLVKDAYNYDGGFDQFIRVKLFYPLNQYVHGDLVDEPDLDTWYYEYFLPTVGLSGYLLQGFSDLMQRRREND